MSAALTNKEYSFLLTTSVSKIVSIGYFFSKVSKGFSFVNL